jgi:prepilin-type N-terminal cleavage/methylation domain-containing protein
MNSAPQAPSRRGFNIVEILITVALIAMLALAAFQGYGVFVKRGENKACYDKLTNFGVAFTNCLAQDHSWPQEPEAQNGKAVPAKQLWEFWHTKMAKYGINDNDWWCPAEERARKKMKKEDLDADEDPSPSYIPAKFGPGTSAPFDYNNLPWMWERQDFHGDGINKLMPGGRRIEKEFNFKALPRDAPGPVSDKK